MIQFRNIYVVPSIHYSPQFAAAVRDVFFEVRPDVIAVELPSNCREEVLEAVNRLPNLTAVYAGGGNGVYSFVPVVPTDSIVEAIRLGMEHQVPVEFVDLNIDVQIPPWPMLLMDEVAMETIGLEDYYQGVSPVFRGRDTIPGNPKREEMMAHHLQRLSAVHGKVLFVCGMAHWESIVSRLGQENRRFDHELNHAYAIAALDLKLLEYELGLFPYHVHMYELSRNDMPYEWLKVIHALYKASDTENQTTVKDTNHMIRYARNQALLKGRIKPDLYQIILSAQQMMDDGYAFRVLEQARYYPARWDSQLPTMTYHPQTHLVDIQGVGRRIRLRVPHYGGQQKIGQLNKLRFRPKGRKHPESVGEGDVFDSSRWGRYEDEMKRETNFILHLEKRWHELQLTDEEYQTHRFTGGLMDGIDYRSMIKDVVRKSIYVKEEERGEVVDFSLILFEFLSKAEEAAAEHLHDYCFQYGKIPKSVHVGFGITGPQADDGNGTGCYRWASLASFKKQMDKEYAIESIDKVYALHRDKGFQHGLETMRQIAVEQAPGKHVLVVGLDPISAELNRYAAEQGKKLYFLHKHQINDTLIRENELFHVYFRKVGE